MPLSEVSADAIEPIMDGLYRVGLNAYLKTRPYNPRSAQGGVGGPFVTLAFWSSSISGLRRVISSDSDAAIDEVLIVAPPELTLGTTGLYSELIHKNLLIDSKPFERAEYSNKGLFLNKVVGVGRFSYCFASRENKDERAFLIEISLKK
jgi:hypothetical protein